MVKLPLDRINSGICRFEIFLKIKGDHEFVNVTTFFSFLSLLFEKREILIQLGNDHISNSSVSIGVIDDGSEARSSISHKAMDVVLEVRLSSNSVNLFSSSQHVFKELFEGLGEFRLLRVESHSSIGFIHIKEHTEIDKVLAAG